MAQMKDARGWTFEDVEYQCPHGRPAARITATEHEADGPYVGRLLHASLRTDGKIRAVPCGWEVGGAAPRGTVLTPEPVAAFGAIAQLN